MDKEKRLARLEEEAANRRQPAPVGRRWPSDQEEERALNQGMVEWFQLMKSYGWTDQELDEELERVDLVHERCFESGLEDFQVISDMIAYFEAGGEWHEYPGPGYWPGEGGP
jgi:hypothetical protein